jgi:hypothetical protein
MEKKGNHNLVIIGKYVVEHYDMALTLEGLGGGKESKKESRCSLQIL